MRLDGNGHRNPSSPTLAPDLEAHPGTDDAGPAGQLPGQTAPDPARIAQSLRASPHAHRLLAHARKTGTLPAPWLHPPTFRPIPALAALPLPRLTTPEDLSDWLALPPDQLIRFTDPHGLSARNPTRFARHATAPPNARPSPA